MHRYANPARFLRIAGIVQPWAIGITVLAFAVGLWFALVASPPDYQQGDTVRIMYIHVPAAWMSLFVYSSMAIAAFVALVWRHPLAEVYARAAAPIGAGFTFLCLVSGSLWGEPMWGTWWVWDARLTSVLILFFLYLGFMALVNAFDDPNRGAKAGNVLLLVGAVNVPIIKFSVEWWNTLHQPASVFRADGPTISSEMLWPLFIMAGAFHAYFVVVLILRMRGELTARKIQAIRLTQAAAAAE
ncbi:heme ABC transporter permease [Rhodospirillum centenum]|uniref:Heme exporter protein C n=1 Tax=Rhodospirillum centenum (strain ATCC 51521 / SW) TaxID=414684 RepID=B6IVQ9_RHOCS|nr:heme ABC transporter permease [Rhodospirillum centenum]ACJ00383.1 cytochrome c-type biogenesis protein CcmC [Rhodospirillum centenum SW]